MQRVGKLGLGLLLALVVPGSASAAVGDLTQLSGAAGCISVDGAGGDCATDAVIESPYGIATSPDGRSVYSTRSEGVVGLARDPVTGALTRIAGASGCITENGIGGQCADGVGLLDPTGVAVSYDGRSVYVASQSGDDGGVAVLARDPATGGLTQLTGTAACVSGNGTGGLCTDAAGISGPYNVTLSPDDRFLYVAALDGPGEVAIFSRDPATGALTQLAGSAGCIREGGFDGCADGRGLDGASTVAISPDGRSAYVSGENAGVAAFARDPVTGALTQLPGTGGCVTADGSGGECTVGRGLAGGEGVAVSFDGEFVYVAARDDDAVSVFDRDPATGAITQLPGAAGCISDDGLGGDCFDGRELQGASVVALSGDGLSLYTGNEDNGSVGIFDRDPVTGALTQKAGLAGCVSDDGSGGECTDGRGLDGSRAVTLTADGASLYGIGSSSDSVADFSREGLGAACAGRPATVVGTDSAETFFGTAGLDVLVTQGGNDVVNASDGDDVVCAAAGNDRVLGGTGANLFFGGPGKDLVAGGDGKDKLKGEAGKDKLKGGAGKDRLSGGPAKDRLKGGPGKDRCAGAGGKDKAGGCEKEKGIP